MASSSRNIHVPQLEWGKIITLFKFQTSVVVLMDYDENRTTKMLGIGEFVLYLMLHHLYPVMITACYINGFQWPITKNTIIFRMAKRTFTFALRGLLYGLQLPNFCDESLIDKLEKWFMKFGHYIKVVENKTLGYPLDDNDQLLWYKLRRCIEPMAHDMLTNLGQMAGKSRFRISSHNSGYLRAIRLSATTKFLVYTMVKQGRLNHTHILVGGTNPSPHQPDDLPMSQHMVYASACVFCSIVDSLEFNDIASGSNNDPQLVKGLMYPIQNRLANIGFKLWSFTLIGVVAFMHNLKANVEQEEKVMREKGEKWKANDREAVEANNSFDTTLAANGERVPHPNYNKEKCVIRE